MSTGHLPLASLREGGGFSGWCWLVDVAPLEAAFLLKPSAFARLVTYWCHGADAWPRHPPHQDRHRPSCGGPFRGASGWATPRRIGLPTWRTGFACADQHQCRFTRPPRRMGSRSSPFFVSVWDHLTAPVTPVRICAHYQFNGCQLVSRAYRLICGNSCVKERGRFVRR